MLREASINEIETERGVSSLVSGLTRNIIMSSSHDVMSFQNARRRVGLNTPLTLRILQRALTTHRHVNKRYGGLELRSRFLSELFKYCGKECNK